MARPEMSSGDRVVIKVGTASLIGSSGEPDDERLTALCDGILSARRNGIQVVLVSSGAIAAGIRPLGLTARPADIPSLQAAAAVGQGRLLRRYTRILEDGGAVAAQVLLTRYDFMHRQQYLNARNTIERLLALGAVPIVNENDTVAVDEIAFGDNDRLAALTSNLIRARLLMLLTDARGMHARDPRKDPDAPLLDEVEKITPELEAAAGGRGSSLASGGMTSKIAAAWVATFSGVGVTVARASEPRVIERILNGEALGTYFHPRHTRESARRLWIAFGRPPRGVVVVDPGARKAVVEGKRSLLPVGVVAVEGTFEQGDPVDIAEAGGTAFARGLVRYASHDLERARGRSTADVDGGEEVVHRDQLVILEA